MALLGLPHTRITRLLDSEQNWEHIRRNWPYAGTYPFVFSTDTTATDPGAGRFKFNGAGTRLYISAVDQEGQNISLLVSLLGQVLSGSLRGYIIIDDESLQGEGILVGSVTGAAFTDNTTWLEIDITELAGTGPTKDGTKAEIGFYPVGVTGAGPTGAAGGVLDGSYPNPGLAAGVAGDGLTETADVLAVGAGHGVDVTANAVDVDESELNFASPGATINAGDTAVEGAANTLTRSDHQHAVSTASAATLSGSNAEGTATSLARSDHNHALGGSVGGVLSGTLPNPSFASDMATQAELDARQTPYYLNNEDFTVNEFKQVVTGTPIELDGTSTLTIDGVLVMDWD